ncbi:MAG: hypothetical protein ACLTU3_10090 [Acutalibacteraceae bacterium]
MKTALPIVLRNGRQGFFAANFPKSAIRYLQTFGKMLKLFKTEWRTFLYFPESGAKKES